MRHDQVALGDGALVLEAQLGELLREALHEPDERLEAVGGLGVMLDVVGPPYFCAASAGFLSLEAVL